MVRLGTPPAPPVPPPASIPVPVPVPSVVVMVAVAVVEVGALISMTSGSSPSGCCGGSSTDTGGKGTVNDEKRVGGDDDAIMTFESVDMS